MKIEKMSLVNVKKLTRKEMRTIMAGSGGGGCMSHSGCPSGCGHMSGGTEYLTCSYCCYA